MFSYTDVAKQFSEVIAPFYTPASNVWEFHLLTILPTLGFVHLLKFLVLWKCEMLFYYDVDLYYPSN
jgi:hypothetical protein